MNRPRPHSSRPNRTDGDHGQRRSRRRPTQRPNAKPPSHNPAGRTARPQAEAPVAAAISETEPAPFRVLIAVHRPRFRGRAERAAAVEEWLVTSLLNTQDVVGQVEKPPRPPDVLILSGDFGRQKTYGIFRAIQQWRQKGMTLIGLVDDCAAAPADMPEAAPSELCDICLTPPYLTADLRELLLRIHREARSHNF